MVAPLLSTSCALPYLAEFVEQFRNTSQPLCSPLEVPILEHQLYHLWVSSADCLLQDWGHLTAEDSLPSDPRSGTHSHPPNPTAGLKESPVQYLPSPDGSLCPRWHCVEGGLSRTPGSPGTQPAPGGSAPGDPPVQCRAKGDGPLSTTQERPRQVGYGVELGGSHYGT
jgi:hypothetical protein